MNWLLTLDERVFLFFHSWAQILPDGWKWLALTGVYLVPIMLVWYWLTRRRETALFAFLAGIFAWEGLNNLIGSFITRERPVPLIDLHFPDREFFFDRPGPSFPSDHTAFMVAVTVVFWRAGERGVAAVLGIVTLATVVARVVTAQHWPGDIIVGSLVGLGSVLLLSLFRRTLDRAIINPVITLARKIGL